MSNSNSTHVTFPVLSILGIVFIVLRLVGTIDWSWWLVLAPFWGQLAIVLVFLVVVFVATFISVAVKRLKVRRRTHDL